MGLLVAFSAVALATVAAVAAVLAGGGTTQLVIAVAIHAVGTIIALVAIMAALDAG